MKSFFLSLALSLMTLQAHAHKTAATFEGTFEDRDLISRPAKDIKIHVFDLAKRGGCSGKVCFRMDVYVNGQHFARWPASPGKKHWGTEFVGVYTPEFGKAGRPIHPDHIHTSYTNRFGDSMPYAMFLRTGKGNKSGIAIHAGHVTGDRESHGCIRIPLDSARYLNGLVKEALRNGGTAHVWTEHTDPR